jgi:hypothetical protein
MKVRSPNDVGARAERTSQQCVSRKTPSRTMWEFIPTTFRTKIMQWDVSGNPHMMMEEEDQ